MIKCILGINVITNTKITAKQKEHSFKNSAVNGHTCSCSLIMYVLSYSVTSAIESLHKDPH